MSTLKTPFRYDFVGSFLRPQALKDAKTKYQNNDITKDEYDKIVNEEITKLVAKQKELGFHAITDGEFRRTFWHLDFMWGFEGVEHKATGGGVPFNDELAVLEPKEGFTMVITSLSETVQELLFELPYGEALSFGIIENEDLIFFVSEEGEIAIDLPREVIEGEALFEGFTKIND